MGEMDLPARGRKGHFAELCSLVREDWETHRRDWTKPGFRAMAMYRFGRWYLEVRNPLGRKIAGRVYRVMQRYVRNQYGIELKCTAVVGRRLLIPHQGAIVIHGYAQIGDDCAIFQGVTLGTANEFTPSKAPKLGDRVRVGAGAMVLGKVTLGDDAQIAPNAVVFTDVPAGATVFTPPPRMIFPPRPPDEES